MKNADIIIIGGGIAGCSAAALLAETANVVILEQEQHPGYHATGRSAATLAPFYGPPVIQQLTAMSAPFLNQPPASVSDHAFTSPRGEMILVGKPGLEKGHNSGHNKETLEFIEESKSHGMQSLSVADAQKMIALLKTDAIDQVLYTDGLLSIDVDALHQCYIRQARKAGGEIICDAPVTHMEYIDNHWHLTTGNSSLYRAPVIVNAAGAWADEIAKLAGLPATGLQPKRRSAALVPFIDIKTDNATGTVNNMADWPMLLDLHERFYSIPFGSGLMISPADETPVEPHDAWPEDIDLATGIDHFQQLIDYDIQTISHRWAGLRTFVADGDPVVGFDPLANGFFWLAGQGGYGIQTSPAIAMLCDYLINHKAGKNADAFGQIEKQLSPARFTR